MSGGNDMSNLRPLGQSPKSLDASYHYSNRHKDMWAQHRAMFPVPIGAELCFV